MKFTVVMNKVIDVYLVNSFASTAKYEVQSTLLSVGMKVSCRTLNTWQKKLTLWVYLIMFTNSDTRFDAGVLTTCSWRNQNYMKHEMWFAEIMTSRIERHNLPWRICMSCPGAKRHPDWGIKIEPVCCLPLTFVFITTSVYVIEAQVYVRIKSNKCN